MTTKDMANDPAFRDNDNSTDTFGSPIIKVIGVGGGGNNAVDHMYQQGIKDVNFVVCNTDLQALKRSPVRTQVLLGPTVTCGLGAGNDPDRARQAAEESADDINTLFDDETKMVFITAGMGGGTGTGAAPVVARLAKERGLLTIGIVTIPFLFEGERKIVKALDGADEMAKYVDALLVINNERLTEIYSDLDFLNAFHKADDTLTTAARSIAEIITCEGHINLDFNDVNTALRNGGAAIISSGYGEGENRVTKAINDALNSPLLKNRDIYGSKKLLFNLYFNPNAEDTFLMAEAQELSEFMSNLDPNVDVIWGVAIDESLGNQVKITILAAGFDVTIREEESEIQRSADHSGGLVFKPGGNRKPGKEPRQPDTNRPTNRDRIANEYGNKADTVRTATTQSKYAVLSPGQMDDNDVIDMIEQSPAYNRDKKMLDTLKASKSSAPASHTRHNADEPDNMISFT